MRRVKIALLTGLMAMFVMPLASSADVILTVWPTNDEWLKPVGSYYTLTLFMTVEVGTATDNATFSIGCNVSCTLESFNFNQAYGAGSGLVTWGAGKTVPPFAAGGTQTNLNTTGSLAGAGDGQGTVIGDGSYVGSIGFVTPTQPMYGDGNAYAIGTVRIHQNALGPVVSPFFRSGEGIFNLAPSVPTRFNSVTLGHIPEPTTASLLALGLGGLGLLRRRGRN